MTNGRAPGSAASRVQRVLALRSFPGLAHLPPSELAVLGEHLRPRLFPRGVTVLEQGIPVAGVHFVIEGRVHFVRDSVVRREFGPHEVVGGLAALSGEPQGARAVAASDTVTLELLRDDMVEVFEDHFPIALAVLRALSRAHLQLRLELGEDCGYPTVNDGEALPEIGELSLVERMSQLRRTLPFGNVSVEVIASLAQSAEEVRVTAGQTLWTAGDPSTATFTVLSGIVRCATPDGRHSFRFGPSSVLGSIDAVGQVPRWYTATTQTDVVGLRSHADTLIDFMEDRPGVALAFLGLAARNVGRLLERVGDQRAAGADVELPSSPRPLPAGGRLAGTPGDHPDLDGGARGGP